MTGCAAAAPRWCFGRQGPGRARISGRAEDRRPRPRRAPPSQARCSLMGEHGAVSGDRPAVLRCCSALLPSSDRRRARERARRRPRALRPVARAVWIGAVCSGRLGLGCLRLDACSACSHSSRCASSSPLTQTRRGDHRSLLLAFFVIAAAAAVRHRRAQSLNPSWCSSGVRVPPSCWSAPSATMTRFLEAHREDPVGHHGLRLRHEPRAGAAAARPAALRRAWRLHRCCTWCSWWPARRSCRRCQPLAAPPPVARAISRSFSWRAVAGRAFSAGIVGAARRHALQTHPGPGDGLHRCGGSGTFGSS